jgi:hypothetical protein
MSWKSCLVSTVSFAAFGPMWLSTKLNPWLGYGGGREWTGFGASASGHTSFREVRAPHGRLVRMCYQGEAAVG